MNAKLSLNGYTFEVTDEGCLTSPDGLSGCGSSGKVGLQIIRHPLNPTEPDETVMRAFFKPCDAALLTEIVLCAVNNLSEKRQ